MTTTEQNPEPVTQRTRTVNRMPTAQLSLHPAYRSFFDLPLTQEIEALADEMRINPQLPYHVEAEPDSTVLYGWQFVQAARVAGRTEMEVTVRQDLDGLNDYAKELEMIDIHLRQGKLTPVTTARCLARAHEIIKEVPEERRRSYQNGELIEVVAQYLKVGKRSAERYVAVTQMPLWLQKPFDRGEVGIALAEKVRDLSREDRKTVRQAVDGGASVMGAIASRLPKKPKPFVAPARELDRFVKLGRKAVAALTPRVQGVKSIKPEHAAALREMKGVIDLMLERASESPSDAGKGEEMSAVVSGEQHNGQVSA